MGDYDHGSALLGELAHDAEHLADEFGIKRRGCLVEEHELWLHRKYASDCHPLLLTARKTLRIFIDLVAEPDLFQHLPGALFCLLASQGQDLLRRDGNVSEIENPSKLPDLSRVEEIREPIITATILMPQEYVGPVLTLCTERRGVQKNMQYVGRQVLLTYELPMAEVVMDFFDRLKSVSRGYASLDYEFREFRAADVVKLDILINGERVDALSVMVHRSVAAYRGREVVSKMRSLIPRQMFDVAVQAAIGAQIIARETIKAMRKNVLAKCYGGDITRKKKLLEKQKAGKKRMKSVGSVEIPQEAFLAILKVSDK